MGQAAAVKAQRPAARKPSEAKQGESAKSDAAATQTAGDLSAGIHAVASVAKRTAKQVAEAGRKVASGFACSHFNAEAVWTSMLESKDERIRLAAAKYLTDRMYGRAAQAVKHAGEADHRITVVVDL